MPARAPRRSRLLSASGSTLQCPHPLTMRRAPAVTPVPARPRHAQEGDVLLSNHPQLAGGSHLPDITVITPVFSNGAVVFFVASRGHHADIGGISPGSMPPNSRLLVEEGAAVVSFKLVRDNAFQVRNEKRQKMQVFAGCVVCVAARVCVQPAALCSGACCKC